MSAELKHLGIKDGLTIKTLAKQKQLPPSGLEVFRRFDALHPEVQGYLTALPFGGHKVPSVAIITDPTLAADLLRSHEFSKFDNHTPIHNANGPLRGTFILGQYEKDLWRKDRIAANPAYSPAAVERMNEQIVTSAQDALTTALQLQKDNTLPPSWTKYVITDQLTHLLVGEQIEQGILSEAIASHGKYTGNTLRSLILGNTGRTGGYLAKNMLAPYDALLDTMEEKLQHGNGEGLLPHVLTHISPEKRDTRDVVSTLLGGQSLLRSHVTSTLLMLAKHPELQDHILQNDTALRNVIIETGRMLPPSLYNVRRTIAPLTIGDDVLSKNSLLIFASFAYGGEKNVTNASQFNPDRDNFKQMTLQGGEANIFGNGLHTCLGKHIAPAIVGSTVRTIIEKFDVSCENDPSPILGGVALRFDEPLQLRLKDKKTKTTLVATT